ncbi:hypothetical protein [Saccharopolyspora sp. ASAGF58]|uniref:hypothetical protein n=1 Tax=Saccharopolyspora sp. ASAGF58 TaxID=2719023 RepID=UPI00143FFA25|nr:hypothetical protein [Saccharopolyspora sp. ASAGF58]QIZ35430.1 hypothetical protein FDZ84_12860 [Saccharopolyspora sp. ASAGF58]
MPNVLDMMPQIGFISAILAYYLSVTRKSYRPQHAGEGEGALTVWHLIAHVEAEQRQREQGGRHRLREPTEHSISDSQAPPLDLQRRVLEGLRRL